MAPGALFAEKRSPLCRPRLLKMDEGVDGQVAQLFASLEEIEFNDESGLDDFGLEIVLD